MNASNKPTTRLCTHNTESITVRGADLVDELIGELSFTEMTYFAITGRRPTQAQTRILRRFACAATTSRCSSGTSSAS